MIKPSIFYINKAKVVLLPVKNKCGSWYEKENYGYFHFLEHMLFQGTKKLPTPEIMTKFAKENGIRPNAYTSGKMINFYLEIPDVNLDKGLITLEETIFNPLIPQEKIKNELNIITQEFLSKWDRSENRFFRKTDEYIFGKDHMFCRDGLGQIKFLEKINSSDLKKLHQQYFQPQNMTITISGNFGNLSNLKSKLTKILNKYPNTYKSKLKYQPINPSNQKNIVYKDDPKQETVSLIWILDKNKKNSRLKKISINIFNNIFGNGIDSLLFKTFRLKYGLVYSIKSFVSNYKNCNILEVNCQIDPSKSQEFLTIFNQELTNIISQIDQEMFDRTIKFTNYQTLMTYDSVNEISSMVANEAFNYKKIFLPEDYINLSKKINFQKTMQYFKEKITLKNMYFFKMTPIKPENL